MKGPFESISFRLIYQFNEIDILSSESHLPSIRYRLPGWNRGVMPAHLIRPRALRRTASEAKTVWAFVLCVLAGRERLPPSLVSARSASETRSTREAALFALCFEGEHLRSTRALRLPPAAPARAETHRRTTLRSALLPRLDAIQNIELLAPLSYY